MKKNMLGFVLFAVMMCTMAAMASNYAPLHPLPESLGDGNAPARKHSVKKPATQKTQPVATTPTTPAETPTHTTTAPLSTAPATTTTPVATSTQTTPAPTPVKTDPVTTPTPAATPVTSNASGGSTNSQSQNGSNYDF